MTVFSGSSIARSGEKTLVYSLYSLGISNRVHFCYKAVSNGVCKSCIDMADFGAIRAATLTTKVLAFLSNTA